jgi:amino acid transporter
VEAWGPSQVADVARAALASGDNMLLETAGNYVGTIIRDIMQVLLVSSLFACVLSFHNVIARYQFVLSQKTVLPRALGRVHPTHHSPHVSSVFQSVTALVLVIASAIAGLDPLVGVFGSMAGVSTVGMVILMLTTSVAVPVFFYRHATARRGRILPTFVLPVLAVAGLVVSLVLVVANFTLVTGQSVAMSAGLAAIPLIASIVGFAMPRSRMLRAPAQTTLAEN